MSVEHFQPAEFTSVFNEGSGMWDNTFTYYTVERDDDQHLSFSFTSYKEIVAGPRMLTFTHARTPFRRPKTRIRR